jgi:hypothetical protein
MPEKQGWRLLTTLCVHVLKAKYYQNSHVISAEVNEGATWRRIMRGVDALTNGVIRRVGSSMKIDI